MAKESQFLWLIENWCQEQILKCELVECDLKCDLIEKRPESVT